MNHKQWPVLLVVLVVALGLALAAAAPAPEVAQAAPEQALACTWQNIGTSGKDLFHFGTAYDTNLNKMHVYGGVDADLKAQNSVQAGDLSGATLRVTWANVAAGSARDMVGPAGAYRSKGDSSAVYWVGGMPDPDNGSGSSELQRFVTKTNTWERLTTVTGLDARVFASAAYDPVHDVIWVVGGVTSCKLADVLAGSACNSRNLGTQYLSFDATTGEPKWNTLAGADQSIYGASLVYDAPRTRMILFGGTSNISSGKNDVKALDLSDADVTKAKWTTLSPTGTGPSTFFHGGAFFAAQNWLVVYGGTTRNFMQSNEANANKTYGLNLAVNPPAWVDINPQGSPGVRVAGGMEYSAKHSAAVFALGRDKFQPSPGAGTPPPAQRVQRTTYALTCVVNPVTVTTPPPVVTTVTPPPGPGSPTVPPPTPQPLPPEVCTYAQAVVPNPVLAAAVANPASVAGHNELCYPNRPAGPFNVIRRFLGLENPNLAYHPMFNTVVWKCGCP